MSAILRPVKFVRLLSGFARSLPATSGKNDDNVGLSQSSGLIFDNNFLNQANFSIQNVLPYLGVSDSGHAEDRFPTRLQATPNRNLGRVTKQEIEAMVGEIKASEVSTSNADMLSSQAVLTIRLCGTILDQETQTDRSQLVTEIWQTVLDMKLPLTVVHYNALLRVHLENRTKFDPEAIQAQMEEHGIKPDKETYQCFISSYCQEGNIEGASKVLQSMKSKGYSVNENIFNSLIIGHSQNGDLARAQGIIKVMKTCGLNPSTETYLTLACAFAKHGDIGAVDRIISESTQAGCAFQDCDYLELLFVLCESDHKDQVGKIMNRLHPETEVFGLLASHLTVRLVNAGHDDVAYNLVQFTVENNTEESGKAISTEFLDQLVRMNTTVSKLLWILKDMGERKIYSGGLENLIDLAIKNQNLALSLKMCDILIADGGRLTKKQFKQMLMLSKRQEVSKDKTSTRHDTMFSCVKIGNHYGYLSGEMLKRHVFPVLVDGAGTWPELVVAQLEEFGVGRRQTVTPMIEYLVGKGSTEAASTMAGIFSEHVTDPKLKLMTGATSSVNTVCNHFVEESNRPSAPTPTLSDNNKVAEEERKKNAISFTGQLLAEDRVADLEAMLEASNEDVEVRESVYTNLMRLYSNHKMIDRAITLSRRMREEQLNIPEVYDILGELIESQFPESYKQTTMPPPPASVLPPTTLHQMPPGMIHPQHMMPAPMPMGVPYIMEEGGYPTGYVYAYPPELVTATGFYPQYPPVGMPVYTSAASGSETDTASYSMCTTPYPVTMTPDTTTSPPSYSSSEMGDLKQSAGGQYHSGAAALNGNGYYHHSGEQSYLHRQLKRLVGNGEPENALDVYRALEKAGKVVNVTETSALIEQLVRSDMMSEAVEVTQAMLLRNMHPMPKIFRFLLNKLASNGSVEDINAIGNFLTSKIKKDVSYDNRLCNAYLSAGRGAEFLSILMHDLDIAIALGQKDQLAVLQDRFPRGGAMGLLDNHPELLNEFSKLAEKFATTGYIAPMNVLWTYHFINGNDKCADSIWQNYVKNSNQIMFQKVCQVARSTGNLNLAFGLVDKLHEADQVTPGARGIAYSCLLDCLAADNQHKEGFAVLKDAISRGVKLEDVNRTALVRLKSGLEEMGDEFPYTIPPKNAATAKSGDQERSLSPCDWSQE